jgi:hypothetical protein
MSDALTPDRFVNVRYIVDDVEAAVDFYTTHLGLEVRSSFLPAFADVTVRGPGGQQVVLDDPAGNPVELVQPA